MIKIFHANIEHAVHKKLLQTYLHSFPQEFRAKILSYRRWQDAQLSLLGRLLLRHGLKTIEKANLENDLQYTDYNKPYFKNNEITFNISHSGNIVVCAISERHEVGIDIEIMDSINIQDFKLQMTNNEWTTIVNATNKQTAFYNYWTQKEAVVKAGGKGLSTNLISFEIKNNFVKLDNNTFFVQNVEINKEYKTSLAYKTKPSLMILPNIKLIQKKFH